MINVLIFFSYFYILLISVIGYGLLFQNLFFEKTKIINNQKTIFIGFYGIFFITFISIITNLFVAHNFIHNIFLHTIGIFLFIFTKFKEKIKFLKIILLISLFVISALLISKTHDDFSYYHLPFTKYLTENKIIFGIANMGHGYKLISSLFFFNSIFYLPFIEYYSFHFSLLFYLIFFNYFLLKEITLKNTNEIIKILYIIAFAFLNLSFNRISEYGTDKAGQLLAVILVIKFISHICYDKNNSKLDNLLYLIPIFFLCISIKTYFLPYALLGLIIFTLDFKFITIVKKLFFTNLFLICIIFLSIYFLHHFISTGCLISPLSFTCLGENLDWAEDSKSYAKFSLWLEQWAKAGAGPTFQVLDPLDYIQNFNWFSNWLELYLKSKILDQLLILFTVILITYLFFKKINYEKKIILFNKNLIFIYIILLTIFLVWLTKHPQLRYGGYSIIFLILSIPAALIISKFREIHSFDKSFKYFVCLVIIIFNLKNIHRINNEMSRTDIYRYNNFPFFSLPKIKFEFKTFSSGLTIYKTKDNHCWDISSPCTGGSLKDIKIKKINNYYFIYK